MVDGVRLVFKKELMMRRLEENGLLSMVGEEEARIMDELDGQEVSSACWNRAVNGDPVYSCRGRDGKVYDVFEDDCVEYREEDKK